MFLPGKSHGWRSLVGCSPWGHEELDTTERLHFHFHALEKEMATHSSVLAWRIPGMAEPGVLPSMGSHRVGHDWSDLAAAAAGQRWVFLSSGTKRNSYKNFFNQFNSMQSLSSVQLFVTPWTAACQASLSITNSRSLLKLMSMKSVMPSNHLILCHPLLLPYCIVKKPSKNILW